MTEITSEQCERTGHVPFKDKRKPYDPVVCTVCNAVLEEGGKPREVQDIYQPGVTVMLRHEADDEEVKLFEMQGITFGQGTLIGVSKYDQAPGGVFYDLEFETNKGTPIILTASPATFMVVEDDRTRAILVDAALKGH